jgi:ribosomal protein S18 acetylase RimI-like enzyme
MHSVGEARLVAAAEADLEVVLDILAESAAWVREERGIIGQWPARFPEQMFLEAIRGGEMFCVCLGREVVGTVRVQESDDATWGDDDTLALYCHSLAIRRRYAGRGLGGATLDEVQELGNSRGRYRVRLDCLASNRSLRRFYERLGFQGQGEIQQRNDAGKTWVSMRYERTVLPTRVIPRGSVVVRGQ